MPKNPGFANRAPASGAARNGPRASSIGALENWIIAWGGLILAEKDE
ncbi:MAG: hypothetical protein JW999_06415 [Methanotrichaceae archaeon]|nr:hypothetical protein [Methanotrichaceae archaeon]